MTIELTLPQTKPIVIIQFYRPPNGKVDLAFDGLQKILDGIKGNPEIYLMGDLNLNYLDSNSSSMKKIKKFESHNHLCQWITQSTRISNKSESLIDHIYSNSKHVSLSGTVTNCISDHFPTFIIRKKAKTLHTFTTFSCRKLKHFDHNFYSNRLLELDWRLFYDCHDPNVAWKILHEQILLVLDRYYPIVTFKNVRVKSEWICQDILRK